MNILITGGTGFIGQALCPALVADGHHLTVLTRDPAAAAGRLPQGVNTVSTFDEIASDASVHAVINLAGESLGQGRWTPARKQAFFDSRVGLTQDLVAWMDRRDQCPATLVSGSAVGYYGAQDDALVTEQTAPNDEFQHQLCRDWEQAAMAAEPLGVRVVRLRIGVVLGQDGGALDAMDTPFKFGLGGWLGSGSQWMSWIHRDDLVAMIRWALVEDVGGVFNAVAPEPVTNKTFSKALGAALNRPVLMPVPGPMLRLMVGEMAHLLLTGQRCVPAAALEAGFDFAYSTVDEAMAAVYAR